jgi:glutamate formiminotransferase/formiminotetrahydrofolate cyclodeaminase
MKLVECVPNFSEGRRKEIVEEIVNEIRSVEGTKLLDMEMDSDHNRSVVTFVGGPEACVEAAFLAVKKARDLIDLNVHRGEHPRMGATDVVPFVPLEDITVQECVGLAERLGERIANELGIPVFLYEEAARRPERRNLATVRKGQFEGLRETVRTDPDRAPDFGDPELHATAGATAVGVRKVLVAYNVNLGTSDINVAKRIAKSVRARGGGLTNVKALGFELKERGIVQVSMNLTDYEKSSIFEAYELVKLYADRYGVPVIGSEIVGLVPEKALIDVTNFYLKLENFKLDQVIETKLRAAEPVDEFISKLASGTPTPGGGSSAALALSQGFALLSMVSNLTLKRKKYQEHWPAVQPLLSDMSEKLSRALELIDLDARAYEAVIAAMKLKKGSDAEKSRIEEAIQESFKRALEVPLESVKLALEGITKAPQFLEHIPEDATSDVGCALHQFMAAFHCGKLNVLINMKYIQDSSYTQQMSQTLEEIETDVHRAFDVGQRAVLERIRGGA